jgi:hypothetical protein
LVNLIDHSTYNTLGQGGWQIVDRPKMPAATQWFDRSPYQLSFTGILDKSISNRSIDLTNTSIGAGLNEIDNFNQTPDDSLFNYRNISLESSDATLSVENYCRALEHWMDKVDGKYEPPILQISGPIPGTQRLWALYSVEFAEAIRDFNAGFRIQQSVKITLYEYNPPLSSATTNILSIPSAAWLNKIGTAGGILDSNGNTYQQYILYTVKAGDTLRSIATKFGVKDTKNGNGKIDYGPQKILRLNNLRDPSAIFVGQVLNIPRGF